MTERVIIDEYTFVSVGGHVQILRNGLPWIGQEPGGFLGVNAWIAAASIIDELRTKVAEPETGARATEAEHARSLGAAEDAAEGWRESSRVAESAIASVLDEPGENPGADLLTAVRSLLTRTSTGLTQEQLARAIYDENPVLQTWDGEAYWYEEVLDSDKVALANRQAEAVLKLRPEATEAAKVEAAARAVNPQAWSVYDRAQAIDPNDPANIGLVQHTLVTARLALDAATKAETHDV